MAVDVVTLSWCLGEIREALAQTERLLERQLAVLAMAEVVDAIGAGVHVGRAPQRAEYRGAALHALDQRLEAPV